jgi:sec-independent protein translocase protein TatA
MFGLGLTELLIILLLVIMVFGAGKLPEIGGAIGKAIGGFKKATRSIGSATSQTPGKDENGKGKDS